MYRSFVTDENNNRPRTETIPVHCVKALITLVTGKENTTQGATQTQVLLTKIAV